MANYQPLVTSGQTTSWIAPSQIIVDVTPVASAPTTSNVNISVIETNIQVFPDSSITSNQCSSLSYTVNPSNSFNLLDSSGNVVGTATDAQLAQMLHSKYVSLAQARDTENAAAAAAMASNS
jgi:hypothetical protein